MKPRIERIPEGFFAGAWHCHGDESSGGLGSTPERAYRNWQKMQRGRRKSVIRCKQAGIVVAIGCCLGAAAWMVL